MRPRRKVVLYSQDERIASVSAYLLRLRLNLEVECCATAADAVAAAADGCELTIVILSEAGEEAGLRALCERLPVSSLLCDPQILTSAAECAATAYLEGPLEPARLLDQVRSLLIQRRGPKRQPGKSSSGAVSAA